MPRRYPKKRTRRRKRYPMTRRVSPSLNGPAYKVVRMKYSEQVTILTDISLISNYFFSANSIFDPNVTGGGHQPLGHDEYANFFNHYCVLGAKISVTGINKDTGDGMILAVGRRPSPTGSTSMAEALEQNGCKYTTLEAHPGQPKTVSLGFSAKKEFSGRSPTSDGALRATFGANPSERTYFCVSIGQQTYGAYGGTAALNVHIEYIVAMIEPKILGIS